MEKLLPQLRFPEFSGEWEEKKLGDVGDVKMCKRIFNDETSLEAEIPFYKIGSFGKVADAFITKEKYLDYRKRYSFPSKGDILISAAGTIGRTVVYNGEDAYYQDSNIVWISNDYSTVSNEFLFYIYQIVKYNTEGGTIQRLYNNILKSTKFNKPSHSEQTKIASFLTAVDEKLTALKKKKNLLEQYKKGMMQQIFSQELRFKDDNGNDFADWEEKKLGEIAKFSKGKNISKSDISDDGIYECIRYGQLYTHYGETINSIISKTNLPVKDLIFSNYNDIIIPASGETQLDIATASCVLKDGVALGGDLNIIKTDSNGVYLSYYLNYYKKQDIANLAQGISVVHLYAKQLAILELSIPVLKEQTKIANFLSAIDEKINHCQVQIEKTQVWKKGLLQQMFV